MTRALFGNDLRVCWLNSHLLKCMFYMLGSASASTGLTVWPLQASANSQLQKHLVGAALFGNDMRDGTYFVWKYPEESD